MLKKWFAEVVALIITASSAAQLHGSEIQFPPHSGMTIVAEAESSYRQGKYDVFLKQLHEQYENAGKAGALRGLFESAKSAMNASPEGIREKLLKSRLEVVELSKKRDQELLEAVTQDPDSEIADKVDTVVSYDYTTQGAEVLAELDSFKYQIPETAIGTIDNKISALETEYYMKEMLLNVASQTSKTKSEDFEHKKIAIQLKKLDKMQEAANEANDKIWMKKIALAKKAFLAQSAFKMDYLVLQDLAAGTTLPQNPVEEKVKQIMMDFQLARKGVFDRNLSEIAQN